MGLGKLTDHLALADVHLIAKVSILGVLRAYTKIPQIFNRRKSAFLIQNANVVIVRKIFNLIHGMYPPLSYNVEILFSQNISFLYYYKSYRQD